MPRYIVLGAGLCLAGLSTPATAASNDNNVEWNGVSHVSWQDLRPIVPMRSDAFTVEFQTFRNDITSARVIQDVGATRTFHPATLTGQRGPYDVWQATLPGTSADDLSYFIELTDGADTDYYSPSGMSDFEPASAYALDFVTLAHAPNGTTPVAGGTVFKVWAPTRTVAYVRGEFNNWATTDQLTKVGDHFVGFVPGAADGDMYKYFFNGNLWRPDPYARELVPADNLNSVVRDATTYTWQNDAFIADPLDSLVIYQLHVGTFAGLNDPAGATGNPSGYRDVGDRVQHLVDLGVNAVMLNPIKEFPGDFSGGYAPVSQFAWESAYGTPDDLKYMVDKLHEAGIAVLLDEVWNHFSISDNFLWDYDGTQIYFDSPHVDTPWGAQGDFDNPNVYQYFLDSVHHVLGEFRIDGYRQDAVMYMTDSNLVSQWGPGQDLLRDAHAIMANRYDDGHAIAEIYIDNPWVQTGLNFDTQYHNEFKEAVRSAMFGAGFGSPNVTRVANVVDGSAVSGTAVLNYFELHDDAWPLNGHDRAVKQIDTTFPHDDAFARGRTTVAGAVTLLSRGVPALLQGTEWLESNGWEAEKIDWSHKTTYAGVVDFYRTIIERRTTEPALFANAPISVYHVNEGADIFAFERYQLGGKSFVLVANMGNSNFPAYRLGLPRSGTWGVVVNNQALEFGGPGAGTTGTFMTETIGHSSQAQSAVLDIPARTVLILEHEPATGACSPADIDADGDADPDDIAAFVTNFIDSIPGNADIDGDGDEDPDDIAAFVDTFIAGC